MNFNSIRVLLCSIYVICCCVCVACKQGLVCLKLLVAPSRWQTGKWVVNFNSFSVLLCSVDAIRCCVCVARLEDQVCLKIAADSGLIEGSRVVIPLEYYCVLFT